MKRWDTEVFSVGVFSVGVDATTTAAGLELMLQIPGAITPGRE